MRSGYRPKYGLRTPGSLLVLKNAGQQMSKRFEIRRLIFWARPGNPWVMRIMPLGADAATHVAGSRALAGGQGIQDDRRGQRGKNGSARPLAWIFAANSQLTFCGGRGA
jgi:hypothetical protein